MEYIIWAGAGLTCIGIAMLVTCIVRAARLRKAGLGEAETKTQLQKLVALNLGALAVSGLGLMAVVLGVFLS